MLYKFFAEGGPDAVRNLIETIMNDLTIKEDNNIIASNDSRKKMIKTTVRSGKSKRTITRVLSTNTPRYFKTFHSIFKFYGVKIFKECFYPVLKEYIDSEFEGRDHPNIWKLLVFDILSAFWRTGKHYFEQNKELYLECPPLMFALYDSKAKSFVKSLMKDSLIEGFKGTELDRVGPYIQELINSIP